MLLARCTAGARTVGRFRPVQLNDRDCCYGALTVTVKVFNRQAGGVRGKHSKYKGQYKARSPIAHDQRDLGCPAAVVVLLIVEL